MRSESTKSHWEKIYSSKSPHEVSWTQEDPTTSLAFIHSFHLPKSAALIDIGGGESKLVDRLLDEGFEDITVLDISQQALERSRSRLGEKGRNVHWINADITDFHPERMYHLWHDRATFHFCTTPHQIEKYLQSARESIISDGYMTLGTFSTEGPTKCSGLEIRQYSEETLSQQLRDGFEKIRCITENHETPFHTIQNFLFCSFSRTN